MRYQDITKDDMANGDGLRVVLWLSGCSHHCKGCQNPQSWDPESGSLFDGEAKQEIFAELRKTYIAGITFSGGDPLHEANYDQVNCLINEIRSTFPQKTIWLYTGASWEDIFKLPMMQNVNVLIDGEFMQQLRNRTLLWRGSSNQRVVDVQRTLRRDDPAKPVLYCE